MKTKIDSSELFDEFFSLEESIHKYFGYKEDWVKIPLKDQRNDFWILIDGSSLTVVVAML